MSCEDGAALRLTPWGPGGPHRPFREDVPGIHCSWVLAGHAGYLISSRKTINEVWLAVPIKLVVNVTQPGCVCRENVIVLFAQKSQVKDTPKIARSKIGKPELPLNVRSNSPFSPQTFTLSQDGLDTYSKRWRDSLMTCLIWLEGVQCRTSRIAALRCSPIYWVSIVLWIAVDNLK